MKIPKKKIRVGKVRVSAIVPWYSRLNELEANLFCIFADEHISEAVPGFCLCLDGEMVFKKELHSKAVAALRDFGDRVDMEAIKSTFDIMLKEGIIHIDEQTGRIEVIPEFIDGDFEDIEVDDPFPFLKSDPKISA